MKRKFFFVLTLFLVAVIVWTQAVLPARAAASQSSGALDTTFNPGTGANDFIFAVARQSDGKVLIGGQFTQVNSAAHSGIARLNPDGSLDAGFTTSVTGAGFFGLTSIAIQSNGKAVIGGLFSQVNSTARASIARLNDTGALDTSFNPGTGVIGGDGYLNVVKLQSDDKALIGGSFTDYNGTSRSNIARLTTTGALDTTFDPGTGAVGGEVSAIAIQPSDGKILIGGYFTTVNGATHTRLARLNTNGSVDDTFNPVVNGGVLSIAVQRDNQIVIGGTFTAVNSTLRYNIARLDPNGNLDSGFDPNAGNEVDAIALQPDGKSVIGGKFTTLGSTGRVRIARLNLNGSVDTSFNPGAGASYTVYALALQPDGKILIGGGFQTVDTISRNSIARLWGDRFLFLPLIVK